MDFVASIVGYIVITVFAIYFVLNGIKILENGGVIVSYFGFGIMYVPKENEYTFKMANKGRKTEGRHWFITAPTWFNKNIWNIGGVK